MQPEQTEASLLTSLTRRDAIQLGVAVGALASAPAALADTVKPDGLTFASGADVLTRAARPALAWRFAGDAAWQVTPAERFTGLAAAHGRTTFGTRFGPLSADLAVTGSAPVWTFAGTLANHGNRPVELQRFDYVAGTPAQPIRFLAPQGLNGAEHAAPGDAIAPRNAAFGKLWNGMGVHWGTAPDPVWDEPDWALSRDVGIFASGWNAPGWNAAFTGPGVAFGEIGLNTGPRPRLFVGQLLDGITLNPGEHRTLERATLRYGDWQHAIQSWAEDVAREILPRPQTPAPAGFCSWYQFASNITDAEFEQAAREVAALPVPPGGRLVQVDDGWQNAVGDWTVNAKFAARWPALPGAIRAQGSVPGTYLAPLLVAETLPVARDHPEWVQRDADGKPAIRFAGLGGPARLALDPASPAAQAHMRLPFERARAEGWDYIKIDFTYPIAASRTGVRRGTTFELQRDLYRLFRDASGPAMRLNACVGEPARYAVGTVDACRLYGDIGTDWKTVRENLVPLLIHAPVGGRWFAADPDVFYMRREHNALGDEENWLLTGSIGLIGGLFLTSDLPSQWSTHARGRVARFWSAQGPRAPVSQRIVFSADGVPLAYRVSYADGAPAHRVGLYNWTDAPLDTHAAFGKLGLPPSLCLAPTSDSGMAIVGGALTVAAQPPRSIRIADLALA